MLLPKAPLKVLLNPTEGIKPSASSVIMLGQSMDTVIHKNREPKNTPMTATASADRPATGPITRDITIIAMAINKNSHSFMLLFPVTLKTPLFSPQANLLHLRTSVLPA